MFNLTSGSIPVEDTELEYIGFGSGEEPVVIVPGLGEGIKPVKGTEPVVAMLYHRAGTRYRLYVIGRRNRMPEGFTVEQMADDVAFGMERLGIERAHVVGISLGGMIAQHLALRHRERIKKLVLVVTAARSNPTIEGHIRHWKELAGQDDFKELLTDISRYANTEGFFRKARAIYRLVGNAGKPKAYDRFYTEADASLLHDASSALRELDCPTLIIGGKQDETVTGQASEELASLIPGNEIYMYEDYGHALYEEAKDFQSRVMEYLEK